VLGKYVVAGGAVLCLGKLPICNVKKGGCCCGGLGCVNIRCSFGIFGSLTSAL
jgi:hypothetical protein